MVWVKRILLLMLLAAGLFAGAMAWWRGALQRALPPGNETVFLPGLSGELRLAVDSDGVPHLRSDSEDDLLRVLGYLHARDRLLQVGLVRLVASGRLSERLGSWALSRDRYFRAYNYRLASWEQAIDSASRRRLETYLDGFNSFLTGPASRPPFTRLIWGGERFTLSDVLRIMRFQAANLSSAWSRDLARGLLWAQGGDLKLVETMFNWRPAFSHPLWPLTREEPRYQPPEKETGFYSQLNAAIGEEPFRPARGGGSNAWAVAGRRSASGRPILASDPHLFQTMPGLWYAVHLRHPDYEVYGVTFPGLPWVVIGRNRQLAWGATMSYLDVEDLVLLSAAETAGLPLHQEVFAPAFGANHRYPVRTSPVGPVVSDLWFDRSGREGAALALQWPGFELAEFKYFEAYDRIYRATSFAEFENGVRRIPVPSQVWLVASASGEIGLTVNGAIPDRRHHSGLFPISLAAAQREMEEGKWRLIPTSELPHLPPGNQVQLVAANQGLLFRPPRYANLDYRSAARAQRIENRLLARSRLTAADMIAIQHDTYCAFAAEAMATLCHRPALQAMLQQEGAQELCLFSGFLDENSRLAPAVLTLLRGLIPAFLAPLTSSRARRLLLEDDLLLNFLTEKIKADPAFPAPAQLVLALGALRKWREKYGRPSWGEVHLLRRDNPLALFWPLSRIYNQPPMAVGGGQEAPWQEKFPNEGELFPVSGGASMHWVVDFGADHHGSLSLAGGNSENPYSPFYGNFWDSWKNGSLRPIRWTDEEIAANQARQTVFKPQEEKR